MTERICGCGCGASLTGMRIDAVYYSEACKKRAERIRSRDKAGTHPLDEVRAQSEETKGRWTTIVREHLDRTLLTTGYVSAEDFEALGIPDEHCNVANAQMGGYASAGYIEAVMFRRWSTEKKASRKSGKYWIYKLTQKGREKLAGLGAEGEGFQSSSGALSIEPGESPASPDKSRDPSASAAQAPPPAEGSGQLFELGEVREKPRSAFTDPDFGEAA